MLGFIKLIRSPTTDSLLKDHKALSLFLLIALRAKRNDCSISGLTKGQALIGDYEACNLTHSEYRCALNRLKRANKIAIKTTNKGTIATILDTSICDINIEAQPQTKKQTKNTSQPQTNRN